jgi:hypothetical protein
MEIQDDRIFRLLVQRSFHAANDLSRQLRGQRASSLR